MPGTKRTASFAFPYERPSKLVKRTTSSTVARDGSLAKSLSVTGPKFTPLKFPSLRATRPATTEIAMSSSESSGSDVMATTPPSLRRASTLTLDDTEDKGGAVAGTSGKRLSSKTSKTPSLTKKSSNVEEGSLVTRLSGLRSGSIVGETAVADPAPSTSRSESASKLSPRKSLTKVLSSKRSSVRKDMVTSLPSGLTKLALPKAGTSLNVSTTGLIDNVDETEVSEALASLKSHLSKEMSKTGASEDNNGEDAEASSDTEEAMAEDGPGPSVGPAMPPGGYLDIAISFDTTGSMYGCLNEVKAKVQSLVQRLQADIPGINIAVIAHGDYCDADKYVVKWIDLGATLPEICDFVTNVQSTHGGDGPECYELVLSRARGMLSWRPGSQRVLIMIGDDVPHEPGYTYGGNTYMINWREECQYLKEMGVKVYGVQAGNDAGAERFHRGMAMLTDGRHLKLGSFDSCFDFLMMICYCEGNPDMLQTYEEEMRARTGRLNKDVSFCMAALAGDAPLLKKSASGKKPAKTTKKGTLKLTKAVVKTSKASPKKKVAATITKATKVGVKKGAKAAVTKKKGVTKKKKVTLKVNRVLKREKLPDTNLTKGPFKQFKWSKWERSITPKLTTTKEASRKKAAKLNAATNTKYTNCKHLPGFRLKRLFDDDTKTPAIYEIAVQCGESGTSKKHVMYYRRSVGWAKTRWDMYLLRHKTLKAEVTKALAAGFSIWIRRGVPAGKRAVQVKRVNEANKYIKDNFDYAWKKYIWRKEAGQLTHREVTVNSKGSKSVISHSSI